MRNFFDTPAGKIGAIVLFAMAIGVAFAIYRSANSGAASFANHRVFIDSTTMKTFPHDLETGETLPLLAPSGGKTGYPTELCYWTASGQISTEPTYVLLNAVVGKPGPTFCPVCGRLVIAHNPMPFEGSKPPPTEAEWKELHPSQQDAGRSR